ncbi:hypothetical protein, partial [Lachnobacterium bovis]|uniref:hypothetical protein n=1 Tax=Lachnobacterium bovis TaxID=140626 RepID=UPI0004817B13
VVLDELKDSEITEDMQLESDIEEISPEALELYDTILFGDDDKKEKVSADDIALLFDEENL